MLTYHCHRNIHVQSSIIADDAYGGVIVDACIPMSRDVFALEAHHLSTQL